MSGQNSSQNSGYNHGPPFDQGYLRVSDIHTLYYAQYGNKVGKPVIYLHGGPGGQTSPRSTVYFNPLVYRVVLFDQRGCGKSTPHADLRENTSQNLVEDIELLRNHLSIRKWHMVFGGSWGSTLALLYAQTYPDPVGSLILRGVVLFRKCEMDWLYYSLTPKIFPDVYLNFKNHIPLEEQDDLVGAYYRRLTDEDRWTRMKAAMRWNSYELGLTTLIDNGDSHLVRPEMNDEKWLLSHSLLEAHYAYHGGFMEEGQVLKPENIERIRHIPAYIIQGRYDMVTPIQTAYDLYSAWPESAIYIIASAGHSATEPETHRKLVEICDSTSFLEYT